MKGRMFTLLSSVVSGFLACALLLLVLESGGVAITKAQSQPASTVLIASASDGMSRSQWEQILTGTSILPHSHLLSASLPPYLEDLMWATYNNISATVVLSTGLPHDRLDASLLDIMPQFAVARTIPYTQTASGATLKASRCVSEDCRYTGYYGLKFEYIMPPGTWVATMWIRPFRCKSGHLPRSSCQRCSGRREI